MKKKTELAQCLADADAMSHFNEVYELLHLAYVVHGMEVEEGRDFVKNKLENSWKKLTPLVKKTIKPKYQAAMKILD